MAIDTIGANALATSAVTTAKIAADAVTSAKIPAGAVVASDVADGSVTTAKLADSAVTSAKALNLGRRRLNLNGAMLVSQRATTKATLTDGYNCLDRVFTYKNHDGVVEESQSTDTPNSEFYNSLKHRVTTADTSIASTQYHSLSFRLEGNSVTQLGFGTSGAKNVTVSFWVKSSVAGAYGAALRNLASNRFNQATMTINSANTWEKKSITYTGDTSGTWPKDNTQGFHFQLSQAMGTSYQGTSADTWVTNVDVAPANQVNWLATVGNTFYLTGLQIEEGSTATEFEHLSFAEELTLCQRYFQRTQSSASGYQNLVVLVNYSTGTDQRGVIPFVTEMRAGPAIGTSGNLMILGAGGSLSSIGAGDGLTTHMAGLRVNTSSNMSTGQSTLLRGNNDGTAHIKFEAEL